MNNILAYLEERQLFDYKNHFLCFLVDSKLVSASTLNGSYFTAHLFVLHLETSRKQQYNSTPDLPK